MIPYRLEYSKVLIDAYVRSYQIISADPYAKDFSYNRSTGAGFIIDYKSRNYLVTCEHVVMPDNVTDFNCVERNLNVGIISGFNDEQNHISICIPVGGWYEYVSIPNIKEDDDNIWPTSVDLAFCDAHDLHIKCRSIGFYDKSANFFINAGSSKNYFKEESFISDCEEYGKEVYSVIGTIIPVEHNGWDLRPRHRLHQNLKFIEEKSNEIILYTDKSINAVSDWKGLSGSPVIDSKGRLLGMLLRVVDKGHEIFVMPISFILRYIDQLDRLKSLGIETDQPFIVVPPGTTIEDVKKNIAVEAVIEIINESYSQKS